MSSFCLGINHSPFTLQQIITSQLVRMKFELFFSHSLLLSLLFSLLLSICGAETALISMKLRYSEKQDNRFEFGAIESHRRMEQNGKKIKIKHTIITKDKIFCYWLRYVCRSSSTVFTLFIQCK